MSIIDDIKNLVENDTAERRKFVLLIRAATDFIEDQEETQAHATRDAALTVAETWYNTNIRPSLTWANTQPLQTQIMNIFNDFDTVAALLTTETDRARLVIIRQKLENIKDKIRQVKAQL